MRVTLSPGRERPIRDGHPWVFSGAIQSEIGDRAAAVVEVFDCEGGRLRLAGLFAWLGWILVHVVSLALFNNRLIVFTQWLWSYFTFERGSRLITVAPSAPAPGSPRPPPPPEAAPASVPPPSDSR